MKVGLKLTYTYYFKKLANKTTERNLGPYPEKISRLIKYLDLNSKKYLCLIKITYFTDNKISRQAFKSSVNRIDIGGMTYIQTKPGTLEQVGSNKAKAIAR